MKSFYVYKYGESAGLLVQEDEWGGRAADHPVMYNLLRESHLGVREER